MADWTDGSLYAPSEPPMGFAAPEVAPLSPELETPDTKLPKSPERIETPLSFESPNEPGRPLDQIVPTSTVVRDPREPFESSRIAFEAEEPWDPTQPLGSYSETQQSGRASAWGAVVAHRPSFTSPVGAPFPPPSGQPFTPQPTVSQFPTPQEHQSSSPHFSTNPYTAPPSPLVTPGYVPATKSSSSTVPSTGALSWGQSVRAAGYPMLGSLVAAILVPPIGVYLLFLALVFTTHVQREKTAIVRALSIALFIRLLFVFAPLLDVYLAWDAQTYTTFACVVLLVGCPTYIYYQSRKKETPPPSWSGTITS